MKQNSTSPNTAGPHNRSQSVGQRLGAIEYRSPEQLNAYARALRKHPERQLVNLGASIDKFGFVVPALIDVDGTIITGHARVEAAKRLGLKEIPTICVTHLTPGQVKAFRLADNRLAELSTWDTQTLAIEIEEILTSGEVPMDILGWETAEIDVILEGAGGELEASDPADEAPDPAANPVTRLRDRWRLGKHRILCGSSLEADVWNALMDGAQARMSFSDAPFNVKISGHVCGLGKVKHAEFAMASGEMSEREFIDFLTTYLKRTSEHVVDGAVIAACMDWRHLFEIQTAAREVGLSFLNLCVWHKSNAGMGSLYRSQHELVLILKKGKASHINNVELGRHGRYRTNIWSYAGVNTFGRTRMADLEAHPTVKPLALVADAILDVTKRGDIVVDAFLGSGTTLLAAERTGRVGYGIEIAPGYVDVAIQRWEKMTGGKAVFEETGETFSQVQERRLKGAGDEPASVQNAA